MRKPKRNLLGMLFPAFAVFAFLVSCGDEKKAKSEAVLEDNANEIEEEFIFIFDGETLDGWEGDSTYWSVENGNLKGEVTPETLLDNNTFNIWQGDQPDDFELKLEFKIAESGNSGINYRSEKIDPIPLARRPLPYSASSFSLHWHAGTLVLRDYLGC